MQLPLAFLDGSAIEEVTIGLWQRVFDVVGWPASIASKKTSFTHEDVLTALQADDPTDEMLQALEVLHSLGTEAGREAIMGAMNDRRVQPTALPASASEREYALELFLAQRTNAALVEVFARAQAQVQQGGDQRRYNEFMGKEARAVSRLKDRSEALLEATRRFCQDNDLGDHVHVRAFEDDGAYVFHVLRSHHKKKPLAVVPGRTARATIEYRPVHGDILRYDAAVGRLRVAARAAVVVDFYRGALGLVLFDDESFFTGEAVCRLEVLQQQGRAALDRHSVRGVGRVRMTECLWERGDRDLLHIRSDDCFRNIEELHLPLTEGQLLQAKLKLEIVGRSTRPATVNIRVPSRIEVVNKLHEQLIDEYLTAVGIRNTKGRPRALDLWTLYPWRHPWGTWRAVLGTGADTLVQHQALVPVQLESVPSADHPGAGRTLTAHPVSKGEYYGVSDAPEIRSRSLSATALDGLQLEPEALRAYLRLHLGLSNPSAVWDGSELLDLGLLEVGGHAFRLSYALRPPPAGIGDRMRARAGAGTNPVLLIPTSVDTGFELARVVLGEPLPSRTSVIRGVITACALGRAVPALYTAPERARLIVDTQIGKIWVDGIEVPGLRAGTHPFTFVEALARASPRPVSMETLKMQLSGARADGDTTARQAKNTARKNIAEALSAAGRMVDDDPFPTGPAGHYRCALLTHVV